MAFMTLESIVFKIKKKTNFKVAFNLFCLFVTYVTRNNCRSHMTLLLTRKGASLQYLSFLNICYEFTGFDTGFSAKN